MTGFSDLPNELIVAVWRLVLDPDAVENFALTSKKVYALGGAYMREHNELKAKFSSVTHREEDVGSCPADTLKSLLLNPRAALYVHYISVNGWQNHWGNAWVDADISDSPNHGPYPEDSMELFRQAIRQSPPEEFDWVRTFATLPSIKSIQAWDIGPVCEGSGPFYDEVNEVNIIDDLYGDVHIPDENPDAFHCCFNTLCHDSRLPLSPKTSAVSHLTFVNCIIRTRRLVRFLESLWALESFDYLSENRSVDSSEPEEIIDTLLAHARYSLQTLRLRSWYEGLSVSGSVTLADFEVTKEVAIACDQLVGTSKLADALPPSVEKVHLSRLNTNVHYVVEHDVLEMTITKAERLPNLKEFTIELHQIDEGLDAEMIAMLKHKCEDVGVLLHITITSPVTTKWFPLMDLSEADFSEADL